MRKEDLVTLGEGDAVPAGNCDEDCDEREWWLMRARAIGVNERFRDFWTEGGREAERR